MDRLAKRVAAQWAGTGSPLIINGSLRGGEGNTAKVCEHLAQHFDNPKTIHLVDWDVDSVLEAFKAAPAVVLASGTYWDSPGHHMQRLIEALSTIEAKPEVVGKPIGLLMTSESIGSKVTLNTLQGVLNSMGFFVPPMCAIGIERATELIDKITMPPGFGPPNDVWTMVDLPVMAKNLTTAMEAAGLPWEAWEKGPLRPRWPIEPVEKSFRS